MHRCHLCNIEYPKFYKADHIKSERHKVCSKITHIALQRARDHMLSELEVVPYHPTFTPTGYFCPTCSVIVPNDNREKHESSKLHTNSALHDKLLNDLVKAYLDADIKDVVESEDEVRNDFGAEKNDGHIETCDVASVVESENVARFDNTVLNISKLTCGQSRRYIKTAVEAFPNRPMKINPYNKNYMMIIVHNWKLKVAFENVHGIVNELGVLVCKLCLRCVNSVLEHIWETKHMENVMCSFTDQHCVREVCFFFFY